MYACQDCLMTKIEVFNTPPFKKNLSTSCDSLMTVECVVSYVVISE